MKTLLYILLVFNSFVYSQTETDSLVNNFENVLGFNSIQTDWNIINSPFLIYPYNMNLLQNESEINPSLYALYTDSQINSGLNFELQPNVLLNQFKIAQNWEVKKKYGVFAKYLGIAQFMGAVGLAAVHISKFHTPPTGKVNFKNDKPIKE